MNYIYDILLNFQDELFDFYDWNNSDNILHIRKIPIIKISEKNLYNIKNNKVMFDEKFLNNIKNRTEIFTSRQIKSLEYAFILSDGLYVLGILVQGQKVKKSKMLIDEEIEALDLCERSSIQNINYKILRKEYQNDLKTREHIMMEKFIKRQIDKISVENDIEKLKYIYFECFNKKETNKNKIILKINSDIESNNDNLLKLYKFFKLIQVNK